MKALIAFSILNLALSSVASAQVASTNPVASAPTTSAAAPITLPATTSAQTPLPTPITSHAEGDTTQPTTQQTARAPATASSADTAATTAPAAASASTQPDHLTAGAAASRQSRPMPSDYASLITRSIFVRGNQVTYDRPANAPPNAAAAPTPEIIRPERALVFDGVTESDAAVALVEDTNAHRVLQVHVGDAIASGNITAITLNSIDYTASGRVTHVAIGQNLQGEFVTPTGSASIGAGAAAATTSPAGGTLTGGSDSIADRMRRRRLAETGGK